MTVASRIARGLLARFARRVEVALRRDLIAGLLKRAAASGEGVRLGRMLVQDRRARRDRLGSLVIALEDDAVRELRVVRLRIELECVSNTDERFGRLLPRGFLEPTLRRRRDPRL